MQIRPVQNLYITLKTDILTFGVPGIVFGIAGEMCRLPAYFDNLSNTLCQKSGVRHLQTADLQTADLQTCRLADCRLADLQTCRLADLQTCRPGDSTHQ